MAKAKNRPKGSRATSKKSGSRAREKNPWTTRASRVIYGNPWISLFEHEVINPAGQPGIYGVVHFKNTALGIMVIDESRHTYLVGQFRYPLNRYSWEIPEGGGPLTAEDPLVEAQRELKEETGLSASDWSPLLEMHLSNSVTDERALVYLARGLTQGKSAPEDTEVLKIKRVSLDEAYRMVDEGEITDAITVAALLKVRLMERDGRL